MIRTETIDILKSIALNLSKTVNIDTITDNLDGTYTLEVCDTYYLHPCLKITINAIKYDIVEVVNDVSIKIKGSALPVATTLTIPSPFFFFGTIIATNIEIANVDTFDKIPMMYVLNSPSDKFNNRDEVIDRVSDVRLFMLTAANFQDWKTKDHYDNAIFPMRKLCYEFINKLNSDGKIGFIEGYTINDKTRFGVFVTDKGHEQRYFNDNLSGVELNIKIPIKINYICKNC